MELLSYLHATDKYLVIAMPRLAGSERTATTAFVAALAEFDRRKLYLGLGFASIYSYCAARLQLKDGAAYRRIETARAARRYPVILEMLSEGRVSVATVALIGPKLDDGNAQTLLAEVAFKTKREVEVILARRNPRPPVPSVVRKLPERAPVITAESESDSESDAPLSLSEMGHAHVPSPPSRRPIVAPLSESHYKLQVTISSAARERLKQIQDLMRHRLPTGDPAAIVEHALEVLHADLLKKKAAEVQKPRLGKDAQDAKGRYIPASVKRAVFQRDRGGCAFLTDDGTRCGETSGVEFHHVQPYTTGGAATVENLELRCHAHNGFEWTRHVDAETESLAH